MVSGVTAGELKDFLLAHNVSIPTNTVIQDVTMGGIVSSISHVGYNYNYIKIMLASSNNTVAKINVREIIINYAYY